MSKQTLPSGATGFYNEHNEWVCTGSQMGRRSSPSQATSQKFHLRQERLDSGGYDSGGAYWGIGYTPLFYASSVDGEIEFFHRAKDRNEAKKIVTEKFPGARFFR